MSGEGVSNQCKHPPHRLYSWWAKDGRGERTILCVVCLECKKVLKGGAT